jgi:hypothetical protein
MPQTRTYDFKQTLVTFNGFQLTGLNSVKIERNEDAFTLEVGGDGETSRSKTNNRSARVTIEAMQVSNANNVLSVFANADELSNSGAGPLMIKDLTSGSKFVAEQAWVVKVPEAGYEAAAGTREWILETGEMVMDLKGTN